MQAAVVKPVLDGFGPHSKFAQLSMSGDAMLLFHQEPRNLRPRLRTYPTHSPVKSSTSSFSPPPSGSPPSLRLAGEPALPARDRGAFPGVARRDEPREHCSPRLARPLPSTSCEDGPMGR